MRATINRRQALTGLTLASATGMLPIAAAEQQTRSAGTEESTTVGHASLLSGGTRKRPVIMEPISLIGPARSTISK